MQPRQREQAQQHPGHGADRKALTPFPVHETSRGQVLLAVYMFHTTLYGAFMKASQVAANPYRAAALIDDLADVLEEIVKHVEAPQRTSDIDRVVETARAVMRRCNPTSS